MGARTKARKRALDVLFSADIRGQLLPDALREAAVRAAAEPSRESSWQYARDLIDGVICHLDEINRHIENHATGWRLDRMPAVDRALLRIATWEIIYNPEVDAAVAISEASGLASELSTEDSAAFVSGVLNAMVRSRNEPA